MTPPGIYIASKVVHAPRWRALRDGGAPIVASWIDEAGLGQTRDWSDLWTRCLREAAGAAACIAYREGEEALKGALAEIGAALAAGVPVLWVGDPDPYPGPYTIARHRGVRLCVDVGEAFAAAEVLLARGGR